MYHLTKALRENSPGNKTKVINLLRSYSQVVLHFQSQNFQGEIKIGNL